MAKVEFRYDRMMDDAVRGVIAKVLIMAGTHGLPGQHHFLITFRTEYPGVEIADELHKRYPQEMTIILQHQFWDLKIEDHRFSVTLSFNKVPQHLVVPFGAIVGFADPSVRWGIKLEPRDPGQEPAALSEPMKRESVGQIPGPEARVATVVRRSEATDDGDGSKIVTLDKFRRK